MSSSSYPQLTWSRFVVHSMVPVTLGNLIGGAVLVGAMYWLTFLRDHRH
jgi:formate transporter